MKIAEFNNDDLFELLAALYNEGTRRNRLQQADFPDRYAYANAAAQATADLTAFRAMYAQAMTYAQRGQISITDLEHAAGERCELGDRRFHIEKGILSVQEYQTWTRTFRPTGRRLWICWQERPQEPRRPC